MICGLGWKAGDLEKFFGGLEFFGMPSCAVPTGGDPFRRIVHDYGFYPRGSYSVNACHSCT